MQSRSGAGAGGVTKVNSYGQRVGHFVWVGDQTVVGVVRLCM